MEINKELREKLIEIKHHIKEGKHDWPISTTLIGQFHEIWQNLYGPLWTDQDTANELDLTLQTIKGGLKLYKARKVFPDLIKVKNKKHALHLLNTYNNLPKILQLKIEHDVFRNSNRPERIIRNSEYMRKNFRNESRN